MLAQLLLPLFGEKCTDSLVHLDFADTVCVKLVISKVLGLGIVAGGKHS